MKLAATDPMGRPLRIFLIAGEPSGDALASRMMAGLKAKTDNVIEFFGVGGPLMEEEGLESLFPMDELTVMGIAEVLPKIPTLLKRINQTVKAAQNIQPDLFITVDAPDFSFRVARKLKSTSFPKVHYVAPSVWAWRPGRARKIAKLYDHLLTILPFEPPYFEKEGLSSSFIGHSVIECGADQGARQKFRKTHNLPNEAPVLMLLPGSRRGEVMRHLPVFKEAVERVTARHPNLVITVPVIGKSSGLVRDHLSDWNIRAIVVEGAEKYDAMASADVALAASGTVGLELALARLPSVIAYKMHPITAWLAKKLVKVEYANLVNILENREVVPEHLQEDCVPEILAPSVIGLLENQTKCALQLEGYQSAMTALGYGGEAPGERAAEVVLNLVSSGAIPD